MEATLDRLLGVVHTISRYAAWVTGFLLLLAAIIIGIDITLRSVFNTSLGFSNEFSSYSLAIASSWGCTVTLLSRSHVRIDSLYTHLSGRARAVLDLVGLLSIIFFFSLVAEYAYYVFDQSVTSNTHSVSTIEIPLAIPQFIWFVGFIFFLFTATLLLFRALLALLKNDTRLVHKLVGARSAQEEIELEKESLGVMADTTKGGAA
jgi:TRAP-type C4-dicarboxylate transport system permease small subunit